MAHAQSLHNYSISALHSVQNSVNLSKNDTIDVKGFKDEVDELLLIEQNDIMYPKSNKKSA